MIGVDQFADLIEHEALVGGVVALLLAQHLVRTVAGWIILAVPVHERIIEVELQSLATARLGEFTEDVALERSQSDVVSIVGLRRPKRKAVVMTRGDGHVLRTSVGEHAAPLVRIEFRRTKAVHHARVRILIETAALEIPLALRVVGVKSPMNEDAELKIGEFLSRLEIPFLGLILGDRPQRKRRNRGKDQ